MIDKGLVCFNNRCVNVEIASSPEERAMGLMNRTFLPEDNGMLFVFDSADIHKFWMKNTFIPLDMMWLDAWGRIIHIEKNTRPCYSINCQLIGPDFDSNYVIEVNGGYTDKYNINVGDNVRMIF